MLLMRRLVLLLACAAVLAASPVQLVSTASYTNYLQNQLYTHNGDNRGFGAQHDLARTNIYNLFAGFGLATSLDSTRACSSSPSIAKSRGSSAALRTPAAIAVMISAVWCRSI